MRLQLTAVAAAAGLAIATPGRGDGTLAVRGVYYKERATRVMQPMLDAIFDAGAHGIVTGHFLVDAITSASASSGAVNAMPFNELRYEGGAGYTHELTTRLGPLTLGVDAKYSTESDYSSLYSGVRAQLELGQKNTVLGLGAGSSHDVVSAAAAQGPAMPTLRCDDEHTAEPECPLAADAVYGSVSQIVGKTTVIAATVDLSILRGYQSNPYRSAIVGEVLVPERHPTERDREAFAASIRHYLAATGTTFIGAYRYYRDDWHVHAHTPELRIIQEVGRSIDAAVRLRYYAQDGADFFRSRYPADSVAMSRFVTDDVKLSTFTGYTLEAKLGVIGEALQLGGRWAGARFEGMLNYTAQHNRFGNAVVAHVAVTIPFEYELRGAVRVAVCPGSRLGGLRRRLVHAGCRELRPGGRPRGRDGRQRQRDELDLRPAPRLAQPLLSVRRIAGGRASGGRTCSPARRSRSAPSRPPTSTWSI